MRPLTDAEMKTVLDKVCFSIRSLPSLGPNRTNTPPAGQLHVRSQEPDRASRRRRPLRVPAESLPSASLPPIHLLSSPPHSPISNPAPKLTLSPPQVYYVKLSIANLATSISRDALLSLGTCLGKMTKTGKFRLHITALPIISAGARHKIWVKDNGAQPFLYGSNGEFSLVDRIVENAGLIGRNSGESACWPVVRGLSRASGVCGLQHGGYPAWIWSGRFYPSYSCFF